MGNEGKTRKEVLLAQGKRGKELEGQQNYSCWIFFGHIASSAQERSFISKS